MTPTATPALEVPAGAQLRRIVAARLRLLATIAVCLALLLLVWATTTRLPVLWRTVTFPEHTSGVWLATAFDLRHGVMYRSAHGPAGYGGTRYFPLYFVTLAAIWRLFDSWRVATFATGVISVALLMASVFFLLRRFGVSRWLALAGAVTVLGGAAVQDTFVKIRADAFAAALNLSAMAWALTPAPRRRYLIAAAALFTLAFATKMTLVFGAAAIVIWLLLSGRRDDAFRLAAYLALGYAAVLAVMYLSGGSAAIEAFRLSASGGATLTTFLTKGPEQLLEMFKISSPECVFFLAAVACFLARQRRTLTSVPGIFFLASLAITLLVLASPGTFRNQLVDLYAASIILFLVWMSESSEQSRVMGMAAFAVLLAITYNATLELHRQGNDARYAAEATKFVSLLGTDRGPILADNPLVPVALNQQPYVLDPFMFLVIDQQLPGWGDELRQRMRRCEFSAIVLDRDPRMKEDRRWYDTLGYGPWFLPLLDQNYRMVLRGQFLTIYRPKPARAAVP